MDFLQYQQLTCNVKSKCFKTIRNTSCWLNFSGFCFRRTSFAVCLCVHDVMVEFDHIQSFEFFTKQAMFWVWKFVVRFYEVIESADNSKNLPFNKVNICKVCKIQRFYKPVNSKSKLRDYFSICTRLNLMFSTHRQVTCSVSIWGYDHLFTTAIW